MNPFDKGCWFWDVNAQMQKLYFDLELGSIKLSDYQLHPAYSIGPGLQPKQVS